MVNFICSIKSSRARTSASALRALASASRHAICVAITIVFSVSTSSGRESGVGGTQRLRAQIADPASPNRALIHNAASDNSARRLWPPCMNRIAPVDPFEQIAELRRRDRHRAIRRRGPDEAAALQPLGEQAHALAIVPQNLDQDAAPAAEHEQMPVVR